MTAERERFERAPVDERFVLTKDELRIGDFVLSLGAAFPFDAWKTRPPDRMLLYKSGTLIRNLDAYFRAAAVAPRHVVELGIFDGGSVAFWFEYFQPDKLVAIDKLDRSDSAYFRRFLEARGGADRVRTYWGVDQAAADELRAIVAREFPGPLDLVIDDASHLAEPTRASFEALFPLLRPGGLYLLEDWSWELTERYRTPGHDLASKEGLVGLVADVVRAAGAPDGLVRKVVAQRGFAVVERGDAEVEGPLRLEGYLASLPRRLESR